MRVKRERDIVSVLREQGFNGSYVFSGRSFHTEDGKVNKDYTAIYKPAEGGTVIGESQVNLEDAINNLREKLEHAR